MLLMNRQNTDIRLVGMIKDMRVVCRKEAEVYTWTKIQKYYIMLNVCALN